MAGGAVALAPAEAAALREAVIAALETALGDGLVAVSCIRTDDRTAAYVFTAGAASA